VILSHQENIIKLPIEDPFFVVHASGKTTTLKSFINLRLIIRVVSL